MGLFSTADVMMLNGLHHLQSIYITVKVRSDRLWYKSMVKKADPTNFLNKVSYHIMSISAFIKKSNDAIRQSNFNL